jgi:hypothetical protein
VEEVDKLIQLQMEFQEDLLQVFQVDQVVELLDGTLLEQVLEDLEHQDKVMLEEMLLYPVMDVM